MESIGTKTKKLPTTEQNYDFFWVRIYQLQKVYPFEQNSRQKK